MESAEICINTMYCNKCGEHVTASHSKKIDLGMCHLCVERRELDIESVIYPALWLKDLAGDGKMIPICAECED